MPNTSRAAVTTSRQETEQRFLDAAERLLVQVGYAGITTRALAAEAGLNHGVVQYYFGSLEGGPLRGRNPFPDRPHPPPRAMYSANVPFLEKWRTAWRFQEEDLAAGYPKIWFELQALAWNRPDLRARIVAVESEWRGVLREAFARAIREYGVEDELPVEAV